jgi:hypothetical protein
MTSYGAIDTDTQDYVLPGRALKGRSYVCADCSQRVIFRSGDVRIPHFAHYSPTTRCTYYSTTAGESDAHKHAKLLIESWICARRPIAFTWNCQEQQAFGSCGSMTQRILIDYKDGDEVVLEYRSPSGSYVADVAVVNAGVVRFIIEVVHTHRTVTTDRPEPWVEVRADQVAHETAHSGTNICLDDCRIKNPRTCSNCSVKKQRWARTIPVLSKRYGSERGWTQDVPCMGCGRTKYNPEWIERLPRQVCKLCLGNEPERVRAALSAAVWGDD